MGKEENTEKMCEGCLTEEEFIKWRQGVTLLDAKFKKVDNWEDAFYGLDSEDSILYEIGYKRVMEPMLSFEEIKKLAGMVKEKIKNDREKILL